jgi:hypothetical protein
MKVRLLGCAALALLSLGLVACGDDDDSGGGCANAQMVCADDESVEIDCDEYDSAPASIKECVGNASSCDAVTACFVSAS